MYSLKNALTQSPEKVKVTVLAVAGIVCGLLGLDASVLETVGAGIAIERVLDLFYVAPVRKSINEAETLKAIDLGQQLRRSRPLEAQHADRPR